MTPPLIDRAHFARFAAGQPGALHFAAHSHHWWPDVTRTAMLECWDDAARLWDDKWETVLGPRLAETQRHVAFHLGLSRPASIAFAPNTHELVKRLFSALPAGRPARVLSTGGEFHTFRRQSRRLAEAGLIALELVETEPFATLEARLADRLRGGDWDMVFLSHVFFDSGVALRDLPVLAAAARPETLVAIDGYHAFMALPVDLRAVEDRVFYLAGGYKYAMAGEGACFLHVPAWAAPLRPVDTGWFASFATLSAPPDAAIAYGEGGWRFFGATFDPAGLYRLNATMRLLAELGIGVADIHAHVLVLQRRFLAGLDRAGHAVVARANLLGDPDQPWRGHFLTFRHPDASGCHDRLRARGVWTDIRGDRLRFGFAAYHGGADVDALLQALASDAGAAIL